MNWNKEKIKLKLSSFIPRIGKHHSFKQEAIMNKLHCNPMTQITVAVKSAATEEYAHDWNVRLTCNGPIQLSEKDWKEFVKSLDKIVEDGIIELNSYEEVKN